MIISFAGPAGSGKSTQAKKLAQELAWPRYYIGGMRRQKAAQKGMTLAEYNKLGEKDPRTDMEVDEYQKKLGLSKDNFIIEGRTSWYFIPHSLKIYIDVSEQIGAERVYQNLQKNNKRNEDKIMKNIEEVKRSLAIRQKSDQKRYQKYYQINVYDPKNYDLFIDSTNMNIDQCYKKIYAYIKKQIQQKKFKKFDNI